MLTYEISEIIWCLVNNINIKFNTYNIRGVSSSGAKGAYAPDQIRNSMFLPLRKKALMGGIGDRRYN